MIAIASGSQDVGVLKLTALRQYTTNKPMAEYGKNRPR